MRCKNLLVGTSGIKVFTDLSEYDAGNVLFTFHCIDADVPLFLNRLFKSGGVANWGQVYFISILSLALKILLTEVKCIPRWSATSL